MSDKASASLSASILLNEIKTSMSGSQIYTPADGNDLWVFAEVQIATTASANLLDTGDSFIGSSLQVAMDDVVRWLCIKNIDRQSTQGIAINFAAGTANFDLKGNIIIGPGEMVILKPMFTTVEDLHARSCVLDSNLRPISQGASAGTAHVAAILDRAD